MKAQTKEKTPETIAEVAESGGNIDKIRDILFGVQMRDYDRRFSRLEERLTKEADKLKEETQQRLENLEIFIKKEIEALTTRLVSEQNLRAEAIQTANQDLKTLSQNFEKKLTQLNEQTAKNESDIRQQILTQSKTLTDEIKRKHDDLLNSLERESVELRDDKADRAALAELFTEMALRLTNDFNLPKAE
jgi:DNA anti-recombination protein RmuC